MEITDPSLGMFSLLPAEVRVMIWKHFSPQLHVGRSLPRKPNHFSPDQEILLASRKIYAEVAAQVPSGYNDNTIKISVEPEYRYKSWITAENLKGVRWDLEDLHDATSRGFCDLPWHKLQVRICIWAPDRDDGGQIVCLYKKVQALVEILQGAKGFLLLSVAFAHREETSWFDEGHPLCSIEKKPARLAFGGRFTPDVKWDYEFIYPLFLKIRNAMRSRMYSTEILDGETENRTMCGTFLKAQKMMIKEIPYSPRGEPYQFDDMDIHRHLVQLSMIVERILDTLPSETANMLRLDRFSSWYTDKLHGNSPYENGLQKLILGAVIGHDTEGTMTYRYRMMRVHNPLSLEYRSAFPKTFDSAKHPDIDASGWSRDVWHCVYKNGIPPLDSKEAERTYQKWRAEYSAPENGQQFVRLHDYFSILLGRKSTFTG